MTQSDQPGIQATTMRDIASVQPAPRQKMIERQGSVSAPMVHRYPTVRGGICDRCGVLDSNQPSQFQYKLCPHYRGMQLRCSYCPEGKDADDVIYHSILNVYGHPNNPDMLVVCCDASSCADKHLARFKNNS